MLIIYLKIFFIFKLFLNFKQNYYNFKAIDIAENV